MSKLTRGQVFPERRERRRLDAQARQAAVQHATPEERLKALDDRLGVGVGAVRERSRLTSKLKQVMVAFVQALEVLVQDGISKPSKAPKKPKNKKK